MTWYHIVYLIETSNWPQSTDFKHCKPPLTFASGSKTSLTNRALSRNHATIFNIFIFIPFLSFFSWLWADGRIGRDVWSSGTSRCATTREIETGLAAPWIPQGRSISSMGLGESCIILHLHFSKCFWMFFLLQWCVCDTKAALHSIIYGEIGECYWWRFFNPLRSKWHGCLWDVCAWSCERDRSMSTFAASLPKALLFQTHRFPRAMSSHLDCSHGMIITCTAMCRLLVSVLVRTALCYLYYLKLFVGFACCLTLRRLVRYEMRTLLCGVSIRLGACTDQ